ncbi:MAG: membrane dipeptidase [Algicola sp.]|nr:membrane dipeptidase [Algicola sp.]
MDRRRFIQSIGAALAMSSIAGCVTQNLPKPSTAKRLYVDGLSFVPEDHQDVKASQIDAFIVDISEIEQVKLADGSTNYKRTYKACMKSIKEQSATMRDHPDIYQIASKGSDIIKAKQADKCAVFLQIQGADCIEASLSQLDEFHDLGLRALQLTHHYDNVYAGGALSPGNNGLTNKGLALIDRLEQKKMLIDLSHSTVASAEQTLKRAKGPIVQTHGAARAIINNARCSPDNVIKGIADSGGVFGVFMMSWWLTYDTIPRPVHYIHHLKHIKNIAGAQAVAIANDYPLRGHKAALGAGNNNKVAIKGYDQWWKSLGKKGRLGFDRDVNHIVIPELNHIKRMRSIEYLLQQARFTSAEIDLVMGQNWQRVLVDVLG